MVLESIFGLKPYVCHIVPSNGKLCERKSPTVSSQEFHENKTNFIDKILYCTYS